MAQDRIISLALEIVELVHSRDATPVQGEAACSIAKALFSVERAASRSVRVQLDQSLQQA